MSVEIITKEDLNKFRMQLLEDMKKLFASTGQVEVNSWLRSSEVKALLKISNGTLQNMRINGQLHPSKIGGIFFYRAEEINALLKETAL